MNATKVIGMKLDNASVKISVNPAMDKPGDFEIPVWTGVVPMEARVINPIRDEKLPNSIPDPDYLSVCPIKSAW